MPARSCSDLISRSKSVAMRSNSAIIPSIWATLRRFSSTWNFFRRISVSLDFIDCYSPEAPAPCHRAGTWRGTSRFGRNAPCNRAVCRHILSFRFPPAPGFAQGVDIPPLKPSIPFGWPIDDREREIGGLAAHQGRLVRGGDHDDRALKALLAQVVLEEFLHL